MTIIVTELAEITKCFYIVDMGYSLCYPKRQVVGWAKPSVATNFVGFANFAVILVR